MSDAVVPGRQLAFDTTVLSAFAEADRLDVLGSMLAGDRCYATAIVRDEIRRGLVTRPQLSAVENAEWLEHGDLAPDAELAAFLRWTERLGTRTPPTPLLGRCTRTSLLTWVFLPRGAAYVGAGRARAARR